MLNNSIFAPADEKEKNEKVTTPVLSENTKVYDSISNPAVSDKLPQQDNDMVDADDVELCIEEDGFRVVPDELQCEEVDMNDPKMDPLEWSARTLIPIPKAYYWDTKNENLPLRTKAWHQTVAALGSTLRVAESVGEVAANVLGLNSSRYDYVTDAMTEEDWARSRQLAEERRKKREIRRKEREVAESVGVVTDAL
mmetsp:Transcript_30037/g.36638  ORF Transcript_30037/g.36638 Transcript_30037/m.36638 type:complete len:196 (-) Transcript_30037:411-998(-)|eukprot:CAMPEP_0172496646 /NCGR_PEP_ID=MMETSP1066-20121228/90686_1 /TAXON_ID=671091 /ORGANISM="Coscinodiscus wailesii, Strain CCMP2513" /LENGTH=195 /DNA_ID=CAMNT_0013269045 /DNA_START=125 /DNA_END=712 /DNA_ORIENTATION=-